MGKESGAKPLRLLFRYGYINVLLAPFDSVAMLALVVYFWSYKNDLNKRVPMRNAETSIYSCMICMPVILQPY